MPEVPAPVQTHLSSVAGPAPITQPPVDTHVSPHITAGQKTPVTETTSTALLRVYRPASADHFYTTSAAERDNAIAALGYVDEGIACYVYL